MYRYRKYPVEAYETIEPKPRIIRGTRKSCLCYSIQLPGINSSGLSIIAQNSPAKTSVGSDHHIYQSLGAAPKSKLTICHISRSESNPQPNKDGTSFDIEDRFHVSLSFRPYSTRSTLEATKSSSHIVATRWNSRGTELLQSSHLSPSKRLVKGVSKTPLSGQRGAVDTACMSAPTVTSSRASTRQPGNFSQI